MLEYASFAGLVVVALVGVLLAALQLPGVWLILAAAAGFDWSQGWRMIGWKWFAALIAIAIMAEVFDALSGVIAARKAGASRRAAVGALLGGFIGMIMLSVPIPIPGVGAIVGGLLGCFLGALIAELSLNKDLATGAKVGLFATIGKIIGLAARTSAAAAVAGTVISLAAWSIFFTSSAV